MTDDNIHLNYYSEEGFLSNGFYKLYANDIEDDLLLWHSSAIVTNKDAMGNYHDFNETSSARSTTSNSSSSSSSSNNSGCNSYTTDEFSTYWTNSVPYGGCENIITNEWDNLSIENLLWDNITYGSDWDTIPTVLPDKTVLCNDSCNLFLKESAEKLSFNINQFPQDTTTINDQSLPLQRQTITTKNRNVFPSEENLPEKLFICTYNDCRKEYAKAAHLKAHLRRHIGDKPYVCTWPNCTWKFSRSDELSRHRRSHSGIKPYKCIYCPKCFSRSDHLTKHRKVHERKMNALNNSGTNELLQFAMNDDEWMEQQQQEQLQPKHHQTTTITNVMCRPVGRPSRKPLNKRLI